MKYSALIFTEADKVSSVEIDPLRESRYRKSPWGESKSLGRLFAAVESLGESTRIYTSVLDLSSGQSQWFTTQHALTDGLSMMRDACALAALTLTPVGATPVRSYEKPPFLKILRRIFLRKDKGEGASTRVEAIGNEAFGAIIFDELFTQKILSSAQEAKSSLNAFILSKLSRRLQDRTQAWMFSTSAAGYAPKDEMMQASYILVPVDPRESPELLSVRIKKSLQSSEAIESFYMAQALAKLPAFLIVFFTWLDFKYSTQKTLGLYTDFGNYTLPEDKQVLIYGVVRKSRPLAVVSSKMNGKLSLSIRATGGLFPEGEFKKWLDDLGATFYES